MYGDDDGGRRRRRRERERRIDPSVPLPRGRSVEAAGKPVTVAMAGGQAVVYERHHEAGGRFHGDFQGLENWSTEEDVLRELCGIGLEDTFDYTPFRKLTVFDPDGVPYHYTSERPLWYQVRRGATEGTLDVSLRRQAEGAGVEIRFGTAREHLPEGGIVAHGPHRADVVAAGYVFKTDPPDGAMTRIGRAHDVRDWLRRYYGGGLSKHLLYAVARKWLSRKPVLVQGCVEGCDCTWCRCQRHVPQNCGHSSETRSKV